LKMKDSYLFVTCHLILGTWYFYTLSALAHI
jgi:hypothetical protein